MGVRLSNGSGCIKIKLLLMTGALALCACAAAPSADKTSSSPVPSMPVPAGKGVIYFYREAGWAGRSLDFHIGEGDKEIGVLTHGTYLHTVVDPATHTFTLTTNNNDHNSCPIDIQSGQTRYFEIYVSTTAFFGQTLQLSCREPDQLERRDKMAGLEESTED